jgi:hypothetical protein
MRFAAAIAIGAGLALSGSLGGQGREAAASLTDLEARARADSNDPVVLFDLASLHTARTPASKLGRPGVAVAFAPIVVAETPCPAPRGSTMFESNSATAAFT